MTPPLRPPHCAFPSKVAQFSAVFTIARAPLLRDRGLDPESRISKPPHAHLGQANRRAPAKAGVQMARPGLAWGTAFASEQPQVRDDDRSKRIEKTSIASKVAQFSGLFA